MSRYIFIIALGGFIIDLLACWPGFMYIDSVNQYTQAITFTFSDWHPPIMAGLWSQLNYIYKGPQVMLIFQLLLLWTSFYLIATTWCRHTLSFISLILLFIAAPYVQNFAGLIVKDSQMALCWLLAVVIMLRAIYYNRKMRPWEAAVTFLLITYGTMVRINALPGAIPLYYLWVEDIYSGTITRKAGLLALVLTGLLISNLSINKFILKPHKLYPEYKLMAHDLAGIYVATGKSYFPAFMTTHPGFDSNYIRQHFTTATLDNIWWNKDQKNIFAPLDEQTRQELIKAWKKSIRENTFTYLENRFDGFLYYLQLKQRPDTTFYYYYPYIYTNNYGFALKKNWVFTGVAGLITANKNMPYMKPWFWLLLPVIQLIITFRLPSSIFKKAGLSLAISSLLYLLPQFFIYQADTEFRYFYWCCIATALHTVLLITYYLHRKQVTATGNRA
ncbi:MAG: hypothetical protein J7621_29870 [Niastella sp.]|nr:hypothetical protein [Niastella sp.]